MKSERDEKITRYLLILIWFSTFLLFLFALLEQTYNSELVVTFLNRVLA